MTLYAPEIHLRFAASCGESWFPGVLLGAELHESNDVPNRLAEQVGKLGNERDADESDATARDELFHPLALY